MFPLRVRSRQLEIVCLFLGILVLSGLILLKKDRWTRARLISALAVCGCMAVSWQQVRHGYLLELALLIAGACGMAFSRIVRTYLIVSVPFMVFTTVMALTGHIQNLVYYQDGHGGAARIAFGIHYPTDYCAHLFFLICCWLWVRGKKISLPETLLLLPAAWFCLHFCGARTTALCLVLLCAALLAGIFFSRLASHGLFPQAAAGLSSIPCALALLTVPGTCLASLGLTWLYDPDVRWMKRLNDLLSDRLHFGRIGMDRYPVNLFGHVVVTQGNGGSVSGAQEYFFLDSSYVYILLNLGVLTLIAVMFILCRAALHEYRQMHWERLCVLSVICLACFMEQHLISIGYHPFLLLMLTDPGPVLCDVPATSLSSRDTPAPY